MVAPNIVGVTTISGKTAVANVSTTEANVVVNSASSNTVYKINTVIISNIDGESAATITATFYRSANTYKIGSTITVPADSTLVLVDKNSAIYLEENDAIALTASANGDLQAIVSYEQIS